MPHLADIRRDYGTLAFDEHQAADSPMVQFERWFADALKSDADDANAMTLSTVDDQGRPNARLVLLKGMESERFIFYTHYESVKSVEMNRVPFVALTFFWPSLARQVRIRGEAARISAAESDAYFASRPYKSQLAAVASKQSSLLKNRAELEHLFAARLQHEAQVGTPLCRPNDWGGYAVTPYEMEFWQGRDSRLHDRIQYTLDEPHQLWKKARLSP